MANGGIGTVDLRLLGPVEVLVDGVQVQLGGAKARALLAVLMLETSRVVSTDRIIDDLWGEDPPGTAHNVVQVYVSQLRKALGVRPDGAPVLARRAPGYLLDVDPEALDANRARDLAARGRELATKEPDAARDLFREALALWRGPALADMAFERFAQAPIERFEEMRLSVLEERVEAELRLGMHSELTGELRALVSQHPLREGLRGSLMLALYRAGRQADALSAYQEGRSALADELGIDPSPALRELEGAILRQDPSLDLEVAPAAPVASVVTAPATGRSNVPTHAASFLGRDRDVAELTDILGSERIVTLVGMGGTGKSRLSAQVAGAMKSPDRDGPWLVELASVPEGGEVAQAVASVMGISEDPGKSLDEAVVASLAGRECLIVLDNCEHVVTSAAALAHRISTSCPGVRILATSRESLEIPGEVVWPLLGLAVPAQGAPFDEALSYPSVALFADRASAVRRGFEITQANISAVVSICRRLDGLPLAIELAAARVRALSPERIAERLDDRFRLLTGGARTADPRQQTLRALVDWSYGLLTDHERAVLARSSVFPSSFSLTAAEVVCAGGDVDEFEVLDLLTSLTGKSLLLAIEDADGMRYRSLETISAYAAEKLAESPDEASARERHLQMCIDLATGVAPDAPAAERTRWLDEVESSHDDIGAALRWATRDRRELAAELAAACWVYWLYRSRFTEARTFLGEILEPMPDVDPSLQATLTNAAGAMAMRVGRYQEAGEYLRLSLDLAQRSGERGAEARALTNLGALYRAQDRPEEALGVLNSAVEIRREQGSVKGEADALMNIAVIEMTSGDHAAAEARLTRCLELYEGLDDEPGVVATVSNIGVIARAAGDLERAWDAHEHALKVRRRMGDRWGVALSLGNLGGVALDSGDHERAASLFAEALSIQDELADQDGRAHSIMHLGVAALRAGEPAEARERLTEALAIRVVLEDRAGISACIGWLASSALASGRARAAATLFAAAGDIGDGPDLPDADMEALRLAIGSVVADGEVAEASARIVADPISAGSVWDA